MRREEIMILVYTGLVLILAIAGWLIQRRVARLERKYGRIAKQAQQIALEPAYKAGTRLDPCQIAKRHYQLGVLVQKRDRVEAKAHAWQAFADRFKSATSRLKTWKGKKLPYTFGAVDVSCLLYAVDYAGVGRHINLGQAWHWLLTLVGHS
jgi:hypothetical protein